MFYYKLQMNLKVHIMSWSINGNADQCEWSRPQTSTVLVTEHQTNKQVNNIAK